MPELVYCMMYIGWYSFFFKSYMLPISCDGFHRMLPDQFRVHMFRVHIFGTYLLHIFCDISVFCMVLCGFVPGFLRQPLPSHALQAKLDQKIEMQLPAEEEPPGPTAAPKKPGDRRASWNLQRLWNIDGIAKMNIDYHLYIYIYILFIFNI